MLYNPKNYDIGGMKTVVKIKGVEPKCPECDSNQICFLDLVMLIENVPIDIYKCLDCDTNFKLVTTPT